MDRHQEFLKSIREGGFYDWVGEAKPVTTNTDYLNEQYYDHSEWPKPGDSEKKIRGFIKEALAAEAEIVQELMDDGMTKEEAIAEGCQWPLKEDAPIEAVNAYLEYVAENAKAAENGMIID